MFRFYVKWAFFRQKSFWNFMWAVKFTALFTKLILVPVAARAELYQYPPPSPQPPFSATHNPESFIFIHVSVVSPLSFPKDCSTCHLVNLHGPLVKAVFHHRLRDLVAVQFQQLEAMEQVKLSGTPGMPRRLGWRPSEQASSGMRRSSRRRHCWRRLWRPSPSTTRRGGMLESAGHGEPRRQQKGQPGTDGEVVYSLTENKMYFSTFICGRHQRLWRYSQADGGPV